MTSSFDSNNWYNLWINQSKSFFEAAEKNLQEVFEKQNTFHAEEQIKFMQQCLEIIRKQWDFVRLSDEQKNYQHYWTLLARMYNEAAELMMKQWNSRLHEDKPIKNMHELYELWLQSCNEIYQKTIHSSDYQRSYQDWVTNSMKFWQRLMDMQTDKSK